jgi:hypothetical protein
VGVFTNRADAERAVDELHRAGWSEEEVGFVGHDRAAGEAEPAPQVEGGFGDEAGTVQRAAAGAGTGAVAGGFLGALAAGLIPGIGPIVAGGVLAGLIGGAMVGGGLGAVAGALTGMGVPEAEAQSYEEDFRSGRTLVTVEAGLRRQEAYDILERNGAEMRSGGRSADPGTTPDVVTPGLAGTVSGAGAGTDRPGAVTDAGTTSGRSQVPGEPYAPGETVREGAADDELAHRGDPADTPGQP